MGKSPYAGFDGKFWKALSYDAAHREKPFVTRARINKKAATWSVAAPLFGAGFQPTLLGSLDEADNLRPVKAAAVSDFDSSLLA